jgi:chromosomal replication initiator protein
MNYWAAPELLSPKQPNDVKTDNIIADVCEVYGIELADLMSTARHRILVEPRQVLFYILHKKMNITCVKVGKMFNKNHATVLHGANNIKTFMENEKDLRERVTGVLLRNDYFGLTNEIETSRDTIYKR